MKERIDVERNMKFMPNPKPNIRFNAHIKTIDPNNLKYLPKKKIITEVDFYPEAKAKLKSMAIDKKSLEAEATIKLMGDAEFAEFLERMKKKKADYEKSLAVGVPAVTSVVGTPDDSSDDESESGSSGSSDYVYGGEPMYEVADPGDSGAPTDTSIDVDFSTSDESTDGKPAEVAPEEDDPKFVFDFGGEKFVRDAPTEDEKIVGDVLVAPEFVEALIGRFGDLEKVNDDFVPVEEEKEIEKQILDVEGLNEEQKNDLDKNKLEKIMNIFLRSGKLNDVSDSEKEEKAIEFVDKYHRAINAMATTMQLDTSIDDEKAYKLIIDSVNNLPDLTSKLDSVNKMFEKYDAAIKGSKNKTDRDVADEQFIASIQIVHTDKILNENKIARKIENKKEYIEERKAEEEEEENAAKYTENSEEEAEVLGAIAEKAEDVENIEAQERIDRFNKLDSDYNENDYFARMGIPHNSAHAKILNKIIGYFKKLFKLIDSNEEAYKEFNKYKFIKNEYSKFIEQISTTREYNFFITKQKSRLLMMLKLEPENAAVKKELAKFNVKGDNPVTGLDSINKIIRDHNLTKGSKLPQLSAIVKNPTKTYTGATDITLSIIQPTVLVKKPVAAAEKPVVVAKKPVVVAKKPAVVAKKPAAKK